MNTAVLEGKKRETVEEKYLRIDRSLMDAYREHRLAEFLPTLTDDEFKEQYEDKLEGFAEALVENVVNECTFLSNYDVHPSMSVTALTLMYSQSDGCIDDVNLEKECKILRIMGDDLKRREVPILASEHEELGKIPEKIAASKVVN